MEYLCLLQDVQQMLIDEIKNAIDELRIDDLFKFALADHKGVANKISIRQLGRRRIEKLHTYLAALDRERLAKSHAFELLLLNTCEQELAKRG